MVSIRQSSKELASDGWNASTWKKSKIGKETTWKILGKLIHIERCIFSEKYQHPDQG